MDDLDAGVEYWLADCQFIEIEVEEWASLVGRGIVDDYHVIV